jgi:hypothetical protein
MLQQNRGNMRMPLQNANQFRTAIAAIADNSGKMLHLINYSSL